MKTMLIITIVIACTILLMAVPVKAELGTAANTIFLMHFDSGLNADYAASVNGTLAPVSTGRRIISSAQSKFGGYSLSSSTTGVGLALEFARQGNWNPGLGTIDMWIYKPVWVNANYESLFGIGTARLATSPYFKCLSFWKRGNNNALEAYFNCDTSGSPTAATGVPWICTLTYARMTLATSAGGGGYTDATWSHVAFTWNTANSQLWVYVNGYALASSTTINNSNYYVNWDNWYPNFSVAHNASEAGGQGGSPWPQDSYIDEFRISNIDRYGGANFTPPTSPYVALAGISPSGTITLTSGMTQQFTASGGSGTYTWSLSTSIYGTLNQTTGSQVIFTAMGTAAGTVTLTVNDGSTQASTNIIVTPTSAPLATDNNLSAISRQVIQGFELMN